MSAPAMGAMVGDIYLLMVAIFAVACLLSMVTAKFAQGDSRIETEVRK